MKIHVLNITTLIKHETMTIINPITIRATDVLSSLFNVNSKYLAIVDVLDDSDVDYRAILRAIGSKGSLVKTVFHDKYIGFLVASRQRKP
jgi:hypothetical protein